MTKRDSGPHVYGGITYRTKVEKLAAIRRQNGIDRWREKNPEPKRSPFQTWLCTFIDEKEIDLSLPVTAGDGSTLQVGDVIQAIHDAPDSEQEQIKKTFVMIDFRNGDVYHFIGHLAQALNSSHKIGI